MFTSSELIKINDTQLCLKRSRINALLIFAFIIGFNFVWYWILFKDYNFPQTSLIGIVSEMVSKEPLMWIFLLVPFLTLFTLIDAFRIIAFGRVYIFDKVLGYITQNGWKLHSINDVTKVRSKKDVISAQLAFQKNPAHSLYLVLQSGKQRKLVTFNDIDKLNQSGMELATFLDLPYEATTS